MQKLDHFDLIEFGQQLGYPLDSDGLCQGFSGMLMQAIIAQEEEQFWKRLKLIEHYKDNFSLLIRKVELVKLKVKKNEEQLNEQEIELLELFAFYDGIKLYLDCDIHLDVFNNRYITHTNLDDIYALTHSQKLEHYPLRILFDRAYAFNQSGLENYLNDLATGVSSYPNLPILATSYNHSVALKYNGRNLEKPWLYVDTNDFHRYSELSNYYRELNTEELAHSLFHSLSENSKHIVFNVTLVTNQNQLLFDNSALKQLRSQHPMSPEQAVIYDEHGVGLLYLSCLNGHVEAIKQLLAYEEIKINEATDDGATPLHIACQNGHIEVIKLLLAHKDIKVNKADECGETPLYIACQHGHVDVIKLLLTHKDIKINKANEEGSTPLLITCCMGHIEAFQLLLAHDDIDIHKAKYNGVTPLYIASLCGDLPMVEMLLQSDNIDVNCVGIGHYTPLLAACLCPSYVTNNELFRVLLENKANVCHKNDKGETALDIAVKQKNNAAIDEICKHAKKNNLSLKSLMSIETMNKALECVSADSPPSLSDLKLFVQQSLAEAPDVSMSISRKMVFEGGSAAVALSGMGLFAANVCHMNICPQVLSENEVAVAESVVDSCNHMYSN